MLSDFAEEIFVPKSELRRVANERADVIAGCIEVHRVNAGIQEFL
jgi:hypothetical protein